ncbi:hypothetical protein SXCC_04630 [Gluconacetobacter sp. SXCC-1]|nr:hypothetical protein SXCC_04630 [Gluconacetobacter sp. SXCC-1]
MQLFYHHRVSLRTDAMPSIGARARYPDHGQRTDPPWRSPNTRQHTGQAD